MAKRNAATLRTLTANWTAEILSSSLWHAGPAISKTLTALRVPITSLNSIGPDREPGSLSSRKWTYLKMGNSKFKTKTCCLLCAQYTVICAWIGTLGLYTTDWVLQNYHELLPIWIIQRCMCFLIDLHICHAELNQLLVVGVPSRLRLLIFTVSICGNPSLLHHRVDQEWQGVGYVEDPGLATIPSSLSSLLFHDWPLPWLTRSHTWLSPYFDLKKPFTWQDKWLLEKVV